MDYEKQNEEQLLGLVYDKLTTLDIDKWEHSGADDTYRYTTKVSDLTVVVSSEYTRHSGDNATLKIFRGKQEIYQHAEDEGRILDLYNKLEEQRSKQRSEDSERERSAPLEQLLNAFNKPNKARRKK